MTMSEPAGNGTERALETSELRFRLLLEALPHIAYVVSDSGETEHYNRHCFDYGGEGLRTDAVSRLALLHPDDRGALDAARLKGTGPQGDYGFEARIRRYDGVYRWHLIHIKPLVLDGLRLGRLGTAVDIHDLWEAKALLEQRVQERTAALEAEVVQRQRAEAVLRDSEARYRTLYDRTPMALQSTDAEARLIEVNQTWIDLFGYGRDAAIGRSPAEFMTTESASIYRERAWPAMLSSDGQVRVMDYQFVTRDGRVFDGRIAARGEFDAAGQFVRTWSAIADVTAEKVADRALRQSQRMEAVGQLTAGIAHDFNNLLTAILGNLELLAKPPRAEDARAVRLIAGARMAAERGARLTAQLLAFSRKQPIVTEPVDVNQLLDGMRPLLQSTIGATIVVEVAAQPGLPPALADFTQLELAVLNLVINARDAINAKDAQGGSILLGTARVVRDEPLRPEEPGAGVYVAVSVTDTGSGIAEATRERIFEPFFTTKEIGKGSGLGLAQVLGIVKQLGGGISVVSVPGEGTCVTVFLPQADGDAAAAREAAPLVEGALVQAVGRVLLVDDDTAVRGVTAEMLRAAGHEVVEATTGKAALDVLSAGQEKIGVMLVDVAMPGMNGVELAGRVQALAPSLPIIFMTGYAEATLLPVDQWHAVLRKPFQSAALEAKVAGALVHQP